MFIVHYAVSWISIREKTVCAWIDWWTFFFFFDGWIRKSQRIYKIIICGDHEKSYGWHTSSLSCTRNKILFWGPRILFSVPHHANRFPCQTDRCNSDAIQKFEFEVYSKTTFQRFWRFRLDSFQTWFVQTDGLKKKKTSEGHFQVNFTAIRHHQSRYTASDKSYI